MKKQRPLTAKQKELIEREATEAARKGLSPAGACRYHQDSPAGKLWAEVFAREVGKS